MKLEPELEERLIDDIYNKENISEDIAEKIRGNIDESKIIEILSVIHDEWVKSNPHKFMQPGRNKEYQFAPLQLLNWKEAKSDLLFLKPILEAAGIEVNEENLEQEFEVEQREFLYKKRITSSESIVKEIIEYPALNGLKTEDGKNIIDLLKDNKISSNVAKQIREQVDIKTREGLIMDIITSDNPAYYKQMYSVRTIENESIVLPNINTTLSRKELWLSHNIGIPYTYTELSSQRGPGGQSRIVEVTRVYGENLKSAQDKIKTRMEKIEPVDKNRIGQIKLSADHTSFIEKAVLLHGGLNPDDMKWEEVTRESINKRKEAIKRAKINSKLAQKESKNNPYDQKYIEAKREEEKAKKEKEEFEDIGKKYGVVNSKNIAESAKETGITTREVSGIRRFFDKLLGRDSRNR